MKRIFVDYKKCLACKACETACAVEHHPGGTLLAALGDRKTEVKRPGARHRPGGIPPLLPSLRPCGVP